MTFPIRELEAMAAMEMLEWHENILLGSQTIVYTDHKSLTGTWSQAR
jgi:hypothetical protein